jgi:succinate-semialdehyde dehydrogenase / glutarate-semialdehyde dehydrogenase
MAIASINPFTGKTLATFKEMDKQTVRSIIDKAAEAQQIWKTKPIDFRANLLRQVAKDLLDNKEKFALTMTMEMGKPFKASIAEVEKCAWVCHYYADNAKGFLAAKEVRTESRKAFVSYEPLGVVLAVMPWNFPMWQVFRFAAPTLMAGNAGILKHASNVPQTALHIENIFAQAGFPKQLFSTLLVESSAVKDIIKHPKISAVTLTGSARAGSAVAKTAGEQIKKTVLELGGSDAYLILEDADLNQAIAATSASRLINCGQSCIGAKRIIVVESVYDEYVRGLKEKWKAVKMGNPMKAATDIGPMARFDLRDEVHQQVEQSIAKGAKAILGGKIPKRKGAFYPPTILVNVKKGMPAYEEELFGPVASIIQVKDQEEAIAVANDSIYGLGAAIFTRDIEKGTYIATEKIAAGSVFINDFVKSDPRLPFGGIKQSGYGRELAREGMLEFVNCKTVVVR